MKLTPINNTKPAMLELISEEQKANITTIDAHTVKLINGHSPMISDSYTWLIYNDETQQYEDTGININVGTAETDPTVPLWAKEQTKPIYTTEELGAVDVKDALTLEELERMFGGGK